MALWTWLTSTTKAVWLHLPLVGRLTEVPRPQLEQAAYETLTTVVFATMPFWFIPALGSFILRSPPSIVHAFENGEGLVYASVLLGPLFYTLTKRYGRWSLRALNAKTKPDLLSVSFPYGTAFAAITAITCAISGVMFLQLRNGFRGPEINPDGIQTLSWFLIIAATLIFFLITAYRNMLDDLANNRTAEIIDEQPKSEGDFFTTWMDSKK